MKIRQDFVTNSSSSSFIISKKYLDEDQILAIKVHDRIAKEMAWDDSWDEPWVIDENDEYIAGSTWMDNFDMYGYLKNIEVDLSNVVWGEYPFHLNTYKSDTKRKLASDEVEEEYDWRSFL